MKIALIGNMNNNNFALMRYFRDLGADAHLLLYANDGQGTLSHFKPESDSWEIEKWKPYIHQTAIVNGEFTIVGRKETQQFLLQPLAIGKSVARRLFGRSDPGWKAPDLAFLRENLIGYDKYIGSGISPAIFEMLGWQLDIFYPYSTGIEFYSSPEFVVKLKSIDPSLRLSSKRVKARQALGVKNSKHRINAEMSLTKKSFDEIGVDFKKYAMPMVYLERIDKISMSGSKFVDIFEQIKKVKFTILNTSRLFWNMPARYGADEWWIETKNSHWLIYGFAEFLRLRPHFDAKIYLLDYGPDVLVTKVLCQKLGIESSVQWLPRMERREIMLLLSHVSVASGEFSNIPKFLWGGSGWEALAVGRPLLQGFKFEPGEFECEFGYPAPPMLPVRGKDDILTHLLDMADHPAKCEQIGRGAREWFNRYNGIGLAQKWLDLLSMPLAGQLGEGGVDVRVSHGR